MKKPLSATLLVSGLLIASIATAQSAPTGGADAKGNAPIKSMSSIDDGPAKPGANSFTKGQAMKHLMKAGYASITDLAKGTDGIWRANVMKGGAATNVALDFKGNISEGGSAAPQ